MEDLNSLSISLYDPGMTHIHRVGLAGLYMTLRRLDTGGGTFEGLKFVLDKSRIIISWNGNGLESFDKLFKTAFGTTLTPPAGLIDFAAHRGLAMGDLQRIALTKAVLGSFLQHNKQNKIPKGTKSRSLSVSLEDKQVLVEYRPFVKPYAHADAASSLLGRKGQAKSCVAIKGWLYPGATQRHSTLSGTEMEDPAERFLCLLFAPVASLYYRLVHRGRDGRFDVRRGTAVCLPHVSELERYSRCYERYLRCPVERLCADGLGDAGLSALVVLKAKDSMDKLGVEGCTILTMGTVGWSKQQRTRTGVAVLEDLEEKTLDRFELAYRCLPNNIRIKLPKPTKGSPEPENRYFVSTSLVRGLIADNIVRGREWFRDLTDLMGSKDSARIVSYEKGGLKQMVDQVSWSHEADKHFVEAVHAAIRNRYGALASQAKQRGETIRFDREFERMRTGLMRAKNAQTLRAELADLFARGGLNRSLQKGWQEVLPLFTGSDWQRARDLALLGLASYTGKGADQIESAEPELDEEEQL